jgi:hypothetical protein
MPNQHGRYLELGDIDHSPTIRPTHTNSDAKSSSIREDPFSSSNVPPVYTIDLSLPPARRYVQVAKDFLPAIHGLPVLFDELLQEVPIPSELIHFVTRLALRRLHSDEHTEEIRGISKTTGVPMYLLVAFNVLLDLFMGCTSGAVRCKESPRDKPKMLHFRTLDWDMPALKKVIVQFEFRESRTGPVIARAINYIGYVGILTAVRKGLSISLNFRPYHNNDSSRWTNSKFGAHLLSVMLGFRPSISAHLRDFIIPSNVHQPKKNKKRPRPRPTPSPGPSQTLADIARTFPSVPTTAAYLLFCDGAQALLLEKDITTAKPLLSSSFLVATNHDISYERCSPSAEAAAHVAHAKVTANPVLGMDAIVAESVDRKRCVAEMWERRCRRLGGGKKVHPEPYVRLQELKSWVERYPITSPGETHFGTVMDPGEGEILWVRIAEGEGRGEMR